MKPPSDEARSRIRAVLLSDWDPSDASRSEYAHGLYDRFIDPLWDLIKLNNEDAVVSFLHRCELETMCTVGLGTERLRPAARKLLALRGKDNM